MWGEDAVIQEQVHRGSRDDGREPLQEFDGLKEEVRRSSAPHRLELDEDASIGAEAVLGERGAEEIARELLEAGAIVWGDPDVGVEIEALELGLMRAAGGDVTEVRLVAEAAAAGAGPWPQRDAALDGGPDEASQDRRDFCERVPRRRVIGGLQLAAYEQSPDSGADGGEDLRHILVARRGCGVKGELS